MGKKVAKYKREKVKLKGLENLFEKALREKKYIVDDTICGDWADIAYGYVNLNFTEILDIAWEFKYELYYNFMFTIGKEDYLRVTFDKDTSLPYIIQNCIREYVKKCENKQYEPNYTNVMTTMGLYVREDYKLTYDEYTKLFKRVLKETIEI